MAALMDGHIEEFALVRTTPLQHLHEQRKTTTRIISKRCIVL